jgi:hypothetical protein
MKATRAGKRHRVMDVVRSLSLLTRGVPKIGRLALLKAEFQMWEGRHFLNGLPQRLEDCHSQKWSLAYEKVSTPRTWSPEDWNTDTLRSGDPNVRSLTLRIGRVPKIGRSSLQKMESWVQEGRHSPNVFVIPMIGKLVFVC